MEYLGEEWFENIKNRVSSKIPENLQWEILTHGGGYSLTRFANNMIHQNISRQDIRLDIRLISGKKVGKSSVNEVKEESIRWAVESAFEALRFAPDEEEPIELPGKQNYRPIESYSQKTAELEPEKRAEIVGLAIKKSSAKGLESAGVVSTAEHFVGLANSNGLFATHKASSAELSLTITNKDGGSGWASYSSYDIDKIDIEATIESALKKAELNINPIELPPGKYTVILEPQAVSDLFTFASYLGFGAQAYLDGMSFLVDKLNTKVFDEKLTIWDDAYFPLNPGLPFDFEGMPRKRVLLVKGGVFVSLVHDRKTAKKMNTETTGHSLPQPNTWGPIPLNLVIENGDSDIDDMVESTERGLLITHFHYVNVVEPRKLILTGMTRDGVFLVENGKINTAVKNLRFTESLPQAFSSIEKLGKELKNCGICVTPAMKLSSFNFSSATEF